MAYALSTVAIIIGVTLGLMVWRAMAFRLRLMAKGITTSNAAQKAFQIRAILALLAVALAAFTFLVLVPLPISQWGYVGVAAVWCLGCLIVAEWCGRRHFELAD